MKTDVSLQNVLKKSINNMKLIAKAISPKDKWIQTEPKTRISGVYAR
ncbi:hypothetical protein [[Eubacterium] cellulosolvens]